MNITDWTPLRAASLCRISVSGCSINSLSEYTRPVSLWRLFGFEVLLHTSSLPPP